MFDAAHRDRRWAGYLFHTDVADRSDGAAPSIYQGGPHLMLWCVEYGNHLPDAPIAIGLTVAGRHRDRGSDTSRRLFAVVPR